MQKHNSVKVKVKSLPFSFSPLQGRPYMYFEIIHLVHTQTFPKNYHFLPPDTHMYVSGGKKCQFFEKFCVLVNEYFLVHCTLKVFRMLNYFNPMLYFHTPRKCQEASAFLMFSLGIEMEHWAKMGLFSAFTVSLHFLARILSTSLASQSLVRA